MQKHKRYYSGFTLVELLVVIVVIGILMTMLIPAINGAVRTAKNSACAIEMSSMSQALSNFKGKYGVYPPSRIVVSESGNYSPAFLASAAGPEAAYLATRSMSYFRHIWPKFTPNANPIIGKWTDWNGNSINDFNNPNSPTKGVFILNGAECLVFFLAGVPDINKAPDDTTQGDQITLKGFSNNPNNPVIPTWDYTTDATHPTGQPNSLGQNRTMPLYGFTNGRLIDRNNNGFPEFVDNLAEQPIVYFSAYEGTGYDPDDYNIAETGSLADGTEVTGINGLFYNINNSKGSPSPNPYTNGPSLGMAGTVLPEYMNKISFQLISAGYDGLYGIGGWYNPKRANPIPLLDPKGKPGDPGYVPVFTYPINLSRDIRSMESDNITNFTNGRIN